MNCPDCGAHALCIDTRQLSKANRRRRRYKCSCGAKFSTIEELKPIWEARLSGDDQLKRRVAQELVASILEKKYK